MANHFADQGWDVTVATLPEEFFDEYSPPRDDTLLAAIDPRVEVLRIAMPTTHLERDIRRLSPMRANFPTVYKALLPAYGLFDRYTPWLPRLLATITRAHLADPFDLVLATGNPWTSFVAAAALNRATGVPYVLDYRDSWTLNQFTQEPAYTSGHSAHTWERRVLRRAGAISFVNEQMLSWYARRYPQQAKRMLVLENGYDADLLTGEMFRENDSDAPLRFGYLGTLTDRYDNAAFWAGWELAAQQPELTGASAHVYGHLGFFSDAPRHGLPDAGATEVHYHGPVPKAEVAGVYRDLDVLLFLVPSSPYVTSGKTYEYLATGTPIVAVHAPDSAAAAPLRGYPLAATVANLSPPAIRDALVAAARLARSATKVDYDAAIEHARSYERTRLLEPFEAVLRELAARGSRS
jgi:glycosyltransferase involved in cell wall biosynthesis